MAVARKQRQDALPQGKETQVPVETSQFHVPNERHQAAREGDSSRPTILIVEDEAGPREALKLILRPFYNLHSVDSAEADRKSTRLNSSHGYISYAVFCLKKKKRRHTTRH